MRRAVEAASDLLLASELPSHRLVVFTDMTVGSWPDEIAAGAVRAGAQVELVDVGLPSGNLALIDAFARPDPT